MKEFGVFIAERVMVGARRSEGRKGVQVGARRGEII